MEFIPKAVIIGVFAAVGPGAADIDAINRIWVQLSRRQGYRQLARTGDGATFVGASGDDSFVIQPPLLQFRSPASMGFRNAADDAQTCLRIAAEQLGATQFANLGIRHVVHAPAPENEGRGYVQHRLLRKTAEELSALERGGSSWAGLKYVLGATDESTYTLVIEPLVADPRYLFIDLDAQYPGQADLDRVIDRAADAERYLTETVRSYLENPPVA